VVQYVFLGEFDQEKWNATTHNAELTDMATFEKVTMWPLVILMVLIGLYPSVIVRLLNAVSTTLFSNF
jgi:NADH:ubiquinone oxidoreductase subunit 4 (subunit M)